MTSMTSSVNPESLAVWGDISTRPGALLATHPTHTHPPRAPLRASVHYELACTRCTGTATALRACVARQPHPGRRGVFLSAALLWVVGGRPQLSRASGHLVPFLSDACFASFDSNHSTCTTTTLQTPLCSALHHHIFASPNISSHPTLVPCVHPYSPPTGRRGIGRT